MRFRKFAAILAFAGTTMAPVAALAETLGGALASAYEHSGLLKQQQALLRAADEDVAAATARLRPVLSYALSGNYSSITDNTTANLSLSASMVLYDFGSSGLRRELAKTNVLATREALRGVEAKVLLRAVSAYTAVQRDGSIVNLRRNNLRVIEQELQAARDRFEVGEITRTDVALAEARLASTKSALSAALGNYEIARQEYRAAIGHYPNNLKRPPSPPTTASSLEEAQAIARSRHPDMAQAQYSVTVADMNVQLAQNSLKPTLQGSANWGVNDQGNDSSSLGLTLGGPIYQGGGLASAIRQANARRDAARSGLHLARHGVDQGVGNAWARLAVANASLQASEQQIRASRVAFRGVREEAALGARTTLDVLNAEQELLNAESARISAASDRYVAVYNLLAAMGLLNVRHLGLNVVTYDPEAYYNAVKAAPGYEVSPQGQKLDHVLKALGKQ